LSERGADRRGELLQAAVRVFARDGFHGARVGDIAEEAGVAHGLLYHYFRSKDEVLETIFRSNWQELVRETERIEGSELVLADRLRRFASIFLGSWLADPDLVRVLIREIARSPEVGKRIAEIGSVFSALTRMFERAHEQGEVRADVDPRLAAFIFYGALEEILTGWVLAQLPSGEADVRRPVDMVVDVVAAGLR
jgi:TetR/AcrR family transcriptional regulator, fatty acid metabolism regulator protein